MSKQQRKILKARKWIIVGDRVVCGKNYYTPSHSVVVKLYGGDLDAALKAACSEMNAMADNWNSAES